MAKVYLNGILRNEEISKVLAILLSKINNTCDNSFINFAQIGIYP